MKTASFLFTISIILNILQLSAQGNTSSTAAIGIGTYSPHPSSILHVAATDKGVLLPSLSTAQRTAINNPFNGLLVYDTTTRSFWYAYGNNWIKIIHSSEGFSNGNLFLGYEGGKSLTNGYNNVSLGALSLKDLTTGYDNTAIGVTALYTNTSGNENTAVGRQALFNNISAVANTALGYKALRSNNGNSNTAVGWFSLTNNTLGNDNVAIGINSMFQNANGNFNIGIGTKALFTNATGGSNIGIGYGADVDQPGLSGNTVIGLDASSNGQYSTAIGTNAYINISNGVALGSLSTAVIGGYANWSNFSDGRFKTSLRDDVKGLSFINRLHPVTYKMDIYGLYKYLGKSPYGKNGENMGKHYIKMIDEAIGQKEAIRMGGFIAQEVEQAAKQSGYDFDGVIKPTSDKDHYRLSYSSFVVPLVKAVQELSQENKLLKEQNQLLKNRDEKLQQQINELKASMLQLTNRISSTVSSK